MTIVINGTTGISGVDGSAGTPAVQGTDTNTGVFYPAADTVGVSTGGSERVRIDSSGNVGIGTSSPSTRLHTYTASGENKLIVEAGAASQSATLSLQTNNTTPGACNIYMGKTGASTNGQVGYDPNNNFLYLYTNNTERMRIDSEGDLLINTTSTNNNEKVRIKNGNDARAIAFQSASAAECGYIYINAGGTSTTYSTSSDYRLKENIAPMTGALAKVQALKPVTYKWKINGFDGQGFIAHELQEIVPDCVTGVKDAVQTYTDEEGNEATRPVYQGVDTSFLVATLTAAIQELNAKFEEYKAAHP